MEKIRLNKYIAMCGVCSRRKADELILNGKIKVDGTVITELGFMVGGTEEILYNGNKIELEENKKYYMLNKPKGYVTTAKEQYKRKSVLDLIDCKERIYPVGRLDMYSEGLLLLTNDGEFTNKITHPKKHIAKKYRVTLNKYITEENIQKLENGVDIGGYITSKAEVLKIKDREIEVKIYEGKNRQVRKMCEAVGCTVINLKRISIGNLKLGKLATGKYVELNEKDINKIFE